MTRQLLRATIAIAVVAASMIACASVDAPAPFVKADASTATIGRDAGAYERCRRLERRFVTDARARVYGTTPSAQAVCVTLPVEVPAAGPGAVVFCVAGDLANVSPPEVQTLTSDLRSCAYCAYLQTNCEGDAGICATSYAVVSGSARIVRLGRAAGEPVWIDLGNLEVARVTEGGVEPLDCLFADGLTLQGLLEPGSAIGCAGVDEPACAIASTAADRFP